MKRLNILIMMGLCFTVGTLFGLIIHLPGGSFKVTEEGSSLSRHDRSVGGEGRRLNGLELNPNAIEDPVVHGSTAESPRGFQTDPRISIHRNNRVENKKNNSVQGGKRISKHLNEKSQRFASPNGLNLDSQKHIDTANRPVKNIVQTTQDSNKNDIPKGDRRTKPKKVYRTSVSVMVGNGKSEHSEGAHVASGGARRSDPPNPFTKLSEMVDGVYWTKNVEAMLPAGFTADSVKDWNNFSRETKLVRMQDGCGRMQNRLLTFKDASKSCARYRINTDQIQGEIFSFYLSRVLGIRNIPPSVLKTVNLRHQQWEKITGDIQNAQWSEEIPLIMTQWVKNLVPAFIPEEFRSDTRNLSPNQTTLLDKSVPELTELVQWSDLIVFDYITANLDRVVNNMFNKQWNSQIMSGPAHNLEKSTDTGLLVFLDNESGLFHSYRLLDKYSHFHESLLKSLCIFRRSTVDKIKLWHDGADVLDEMWEMFQKEEPLHRSLPWFPDKNVKILKSRISDVYNQIRHCENIFGEGRDR
jgi:four-jointed box protein 1